MNTLIILLGCNVARLLIDRIHTVVHFMETAPHFPEGGAFGKTTWFLSGGIKNPNPDARKSEALQMMDTLGYLLTNPRNHTFVLDELSQNTAENLYYASHYLNTTSTEFSNVFVVTSRFHFMRASTLLAMIDPSRPYQWILGKQALDDSDYWETIHLRNAKSDVDKARKAGLRIE